MKRLLILLFTIINVAGLDASPKLEAGKRYHIVCNQFPQGCVVDGATAGKNTPLFYLNTSTQSDESYWEFEQKSVDAYYIKNVKTGQYITYDGVRQDSPQLRRYISMTDEKDENKSLWYIILDGNNYVLRNGDQYQQLWDVRVDSYCVGTYENLGNPSTNQQFYFLDENGEKVTERAANDTGNGFDVTSWLDATCESPDGWQVEGDPWTDPGFGSYWNDETMASVESPFLEHWHSQHQGGLRNARIWQTLHNLPAGDYMLQADVIAVLQGWNSSENGTPATGVYLFANDQQAECSTYSERPKTFIVNVTISEEGEIDLGLRNEDTNANWIAFDNLMLIFQGTEEVMMEGEKEKVRKELSEYLSSSEIELLISQAGNDFFALEELRKKASTLGGADPLAKALKDITIDGHAIVYCQSLDLYLCTMPQELFGSPHTAVINYTPRTGSGNLKIGAATIEPGGEFRFSALSGGRKYKFTATDPDGNSIAKYVTFTSLPIVKMYGTFSNEYSQGSIIVHEPDAPLPQLLNMKAKWRGGITNGYGKHKRNYHVKLLDENGEKLEKKFFGLRNDNSWILESCQVDMSRIRNRVLTDLWNDYSTPPYYIRQESKARTGSRGRFVELILNDEYRGIYCMTENMDRKQMKLKKYDEETNTVHGQLFKSKDWSYAVFMGHDSNSNVYPGRSPMWYDAWSESWDQYYVKYPDHEDVGYNTDWSSLYNAVDLVCSASNANFGRNIGDYFDIPVVIDYYILMETILSTDNHGKNMFFAIYDKQDSEKVTLGVWDMDATCGQRWSDDYWHQSFLGPEQDYSRFITNYEHGDYNLFRRLRNHNPDDFNMKVRLRYRDLREGPLATESILNRFRTQLNEFKTCGAAQREYDKWSYDTDVAGRELDFDNEMDYLDDWFTRRMKYLDNVRFKIDELPSAITTINRTTLNDDVVYDMRGMKIGTADDLDRLPSGIYVVNGRKVVISK
ncbi:MAG: CotH kinase family protein [Prevotella sp.]|nr:CotH kinase family protein [Prevotella sp.]